MERSLDLQLLDEALGGRTGLPTPEELQQLMADAEVQLLLRQSSIDQQLIDTAWYLHGVASIDQARQRYTLGRQRQAFLVSAHIFDLTLNQSGWTPAERLSLGFAAAIGYRRGNRDPNATAMMNRLRDVVDVESTVVDHFGTLSLEAGLAFLGFETRTLFTWFRTWRQQLATIAVDSQLSDLTATVFGPTQMVVLGAEDLLNYFSRGDVERLARGRERLRMVATGDAGPEDLNSRWVAAHLLRFSGEAEAGSLWNPEVVPPSVPTLVRQAFTIGNPPILCLWEPQRELLSGSRSPLDEDVRRMVLSVPTSGGKTLVAQMLAVEHLARTNRSVCYVAPTRSLGREVRRSMSSRIRILQRETGSDQPDYSPFLSFLWSLDDPGAQADVEVMTPERLGHLLRHDANGVLDRFGMFIFDEAQLIKEAGRGFVLESVIAFLDYLTADTEHQIALISAAMGNGGGIAQWLDPAGNCLLHESDWRGPRRLHAVFNTKALWGTTQVEPTTGSKWKYRHTTELEGVIRLRMANGQVKQLVTTGDTGWRLVRKSKDGSDFPSEIEIDRTRQTPNYKIASDMIGELGHAGSVLIVASTRKQAQQLAGALAASRDEQPSLTLLVNFVEQQLSANHPLVWMLRRGVGFHHAGLPIEVLEALEEAVRRDELPYLACTSTLTDGVNLPVRTVVIYDQPFPGQHEDSHLSGARLVNAMGRAGRAGKETEGWIVLVRAAAPSETDFSDLNPDGDALAVTSSMITDGALESFAELEQALRNDQDAIFQAAAEAADFVGFVWLVLATEEAHGVDPNTVDLTRVVDSTLAAHQSSAMRELCVQIASRTRDRYVATDSSARRRWVRTGTSIASARTIDDMAGEVANAAMKFVEGSSAAELVIPEVAISWLSDVFIELLNLNEAPLWRFRTSVQGGDIDVKPRDLLAGWVAGRSLPELANGFLRAASDGAWRIEQMVDVVTTHFEHYFSWTVGALIELVNRRLAEASLNVEVCPELGGYIRYGVNSPQALLLMTSGIRSRRLAHAVTSHLPGGLAPGVAGLREWLGTMSISAWRQNFGATSTEVLDLLEFTRPRSRSLLKTLLENGSVSVHLPAGPSNPAKYDGPVTLLPVAGEPLPEPLAVYVDGEFVSVIASQDQADVDAILDTGLDVELTLEASQDSVSLRVALPIVDD
ncbi:superfamily II helicase (plasmid) [Mycobacterium sp. JS623]|uniref:DEAD/DEAH box helicase n=1 Tax=Mycobacterium sp. JS623 TaxID=212767 RepID=UPI0002A55DC4|nr:DEAD/DEAH box helicase [Mycobacterium sp. JS623]AGB26822.1 superfamily II helicase [Mycobacterium sp. JS623]